MNFFNKLAKLFEDLGTKAEERRAKRLEKRLQKAEKKAQKAIAKVQTIKAKIITTTKVQTKIKQPTPNDQKSGKKIINEQEERARYALSTEDLLAYLSELYARNFILLGNEYAKTMLTDGYNELKELIESGAITTKEEIDAKFYALIREINEYMG